MEKVISYKCLDGSLKPNVKEALVWDRTLELRGILQRDGMARDGSMTSTTAASEVVKNFDEIKKVIDSFNRKIRAAEVKMAKLVKAT